MAGQAGDPDAEREGLTVAEWQRPAYETQVDLSTGNVVQVRESTEEIVLRLREHAPCTGFPDRLELAVRRNEAATLEGHGTRAWTLRLECGRGLPRAARTGA